MQEKLDRIKEELSNQDLFIVHDVTSVNHKPHPYMIGSKHVSYASKNHSGMLNEEVCRNIPCSHPGCNLSYDEHTSDLVCFLKLSRNGSNEEASEIMKELVDDLGENYVDGFSFIETEEKFRIN